MLFPFFPKQKKNHIENNKNQQNIEYINQIKQSLKRESNDFCIECGIKHPQYISINNSIFLCKECILNHLQLSQEASTIIRNDLKILTLNEIQYIYNGGNQKLLKFINDEFPELKKFEPQIFYNTKAMDFYRKRLKYITEGGEEPIKPPINEAYLLIKKNEESFMTDMEMEGEEPLNEINKNQKDDNIKNDINKNKKEEISNINNDSNNNEIKNNGKNNLESKTKHNFFNLKNNNIKFPPNNFVDENNNMKIKIFNKSNFKNFKDNIRYSRLSKNIKFKHNYNNFDNESEANNYNYSTNKTCDTIEVTNSNFKIFKNRGSKDNTPIKSGIFSPQPLTNFQNSISDINKIKHNVYSKPKGISFFQKYKLRTKSDYPKFNSNKNNEIKLVFNMNEFNIDNKDNNNNSIKENKTKEEKNNILNYNENVKNTKINHFNFITKNKNGEKLERKKINKTYINSLNERKNKVKEKYVNKNKNYSHDNEIQLISAKNEKDKDKINKDNIAVNISQVNIIKNINNININIDSFNEKKQSNKTEIDFHKKNEDKSLNEKLNKKREIYNAEIEEKENKKLIAENLIEYKRNNTNFETETISRPKNSIRYFQSFASNRSINREIKSNQKLVIKRNSDSSERKNYTFDNIREKYKNKEKEKIKKIDEKNKLIQKMNYKGINKSMDEPYKGYIKESIRNKYKKKKIN